jgi:cyclic pyranopterin monophosphate synthase
MPLPTPKRTERRRLSHLDRSGRPRMVDVSAKPVSARHATAEAEVAMAQETISLVVDGGGTKGDVLTVAELAGVMGGKRTSDLVPLCHPIPLTDLAVEVRPDRARGALVIRATAATVAQTGVEMEALTAASVAALTVYDMIKGVDRGAEIRHLRVVEKSGGRSGTWRRPTPSETGDETEPLPRAARGTRGPRRRG